MNPTPGSEGGPPWPLWVKVWYATLATGAAGLLVGHTFWPTAFTLDAPSLGLIVLLAAIPLVAADRIKALRAGSAEVVFREQASTRPIERRQEEAVLDPAAASTVPSTQPEAPGPRLRFVEVWHGRTQLVVRENVINVQTRDAATRIRQTGRWLEVIGLEVRLDGPSGESPAEVRDAVIELAFLSPDSGERLVATFGRWSANPQAIGVEQLRLDEVLRRTLTPGQGHQLDVAVKYEDNGRCYAAGSDLWLAPEAEDPSLLLNAPAYIVQATILSLDLASPKVGWFQLFNTQGQYPSLQMTHLPDYQPRRA